MLWRVWLWWDEVVWRLGRWWRTGGADDIGSLVFGLIVGAVVIGLVWLSVRAL